MLEQNLARVPVMEVILVHDPTNSKWSSQSCSSLLNRCHVLVRGAWYTVFLLPRKTGQHSRVSFFCWASVNSFENSHEFTASSVLSITSYIILMMSSFITSLISSIELHVLVSFASEDVTRCHATRDVTQRSPLWRSVAWHLQKRMRKRLSDYKIGGKIKGDGVDFRTRKWSRW